MQAQARNRLIYEMFMLDIFKNILSGLKFNPFVKKPNNQSNKWLQHVWRTDRDRQTATLNCEISTVWETKPMVTAGNGSAVCAEQPCSKVV